MAELVINQIYEIELCSGEVRRWQYLGPDSRRLIWWMDVETQTEFNEGSLDSLVKIRKGFKVARSRQ